MPRHRDALPQLGTRPFLTDGGIETTLIYHEGLELPDFAAFDLLSRPGGEDALRRYFAPYVELAERYDTGLVLESPTWRASADWGARLGYDARRLADVNRRAIGMLVELRDASSARPVVISGCIGPRGDGYVPSARMSPVEAARYHAAQVETFAGTEADMVAAITMNYVDEAVGIAVAARQAGMPATISFTVETDGRLPDGTTLGDAIAQVDDATDAHPAYYMINCAHPTHFEAELAAGGAWAARVRGVRANASRKSHAELNEATELDAGDPSELAEQHAHLLDLAPWITVLGGCCGTDHRHVERIASACLERGRAAA